MPIDVSLFMRKLYHFFEARTSWHLALILVYYLLVTLPHEWVGVMMASTFGSLPRSQYNLVILCLFFILLVGASWMMIPRFSQHPRKKPLIGFSLFAVALCCLTVQFLFVINVEMVHFLQYAILAILIYPLLKNSGLTLLWITTAGFFDEAFQYLYLSPQRTDYFDFNDVIADLLGGILGLIVVKLTLQIQEANIKTFNSWTVSHLILALFLLVTYSTGHWSIYPNEHTSIVLVKKSFNDFWTTIHPGVTYHVVRPLEGIVIILVLILIFRKL